MANRGITLAFFFLSWFVVLTLSWAILGTVFDEPPPRYYGRDDSIRFWRYEKPYEEPIWSEMQRAGGIWKEGERK